MIRPFHKIPDIFWDIYKFPRYFIDCVRFLENLVVFNNIQCFFRRARWVFRNFLETIIILHTRDRNSPFSGFSLISYQLEHKLDKAAIFFMADADLIDELKSSSSTHSSTANFLAQVIQNRFILKQNLEKFREFFEILSNIFVLFTIFFKNFQKGIRRF